MKLTQFKKLSLIVFTLLVAVANIGCTFKTPSTPDTAANAPEPPQTATPDFTHISDVQVKKRTFFNFLRPFIRYENQLISQQRQQLIEARDTLAAGKPLSGTDSQQLIAIAGHYRYEMDIINQAHINALLSRVDTIPEQLVLTQAAVESGWGSSRFAQQGNNYFGQWCYKKGCGFVPKQRTEGKHHEVAKFNSVAESVAAYINNLNSHRAYHNFRELRGTLRQQQQEPTAEQLAHGLINYSERGQAYVNDLLGILSYNKKLLSEPAEYKA